ncbi:hypothetical protein TraAM80_05506 [Trypanosoma rangeli]|uniref:Uncharacterized protein n=1 Tax=Trypanosoma rangeli TaxID=5698 RepID=A0A422NFM2_TRYRA|nr:uncharacterized protein TraAM80_05506 [Trypanosoma rangeli]RNF04239.1 hypothetical protein TraAM80_05506 [Trypanosoma rangeli]|eukprot:RNF04239.1 hypothetical protein TraAM80_05506 [Trypanosoma rangeli]
MTRLHEGSIYARLAILQWAAAIFHREYGVFGDISASDIAVLLHAIFNTPCKGDSVITGKSAVVSVHDIQFCENPTPTTLFLNAKRVLSLVQTLSSCAVDGNSDKNVADSCCGVGGGGCRPLPPLPPPAVGNMTVSAWMEGKAFVEELKMWRWIRAEAFRRGLEIEELERRVQAFLRGAVESGKPPLPHAGTVVESVGRLLGADSGLPADVVKKNAVSPRKRSRETEEVSTNASGSALPPDDGGNNHVRVLTATNAPTADGCEEGVRNLLRTGGVAQSAGRDGEVIVITQRHVDVARELQEEAATLSHLTCDGVTIAPRLLNVLEEVKKELAERRLVAEVAASAASSKNTGSVTTAQRRSGPHVGDETHSSGIPHVGCSSCPAVFTEALQQNYKAIARLEAAREMAVAACLKRDAAGLLEALSFV